MRVVLFLALVFAAACDSRYPAEMPGRLISGTIRYNGAEHLKLARPIVQLAALALVPPPPGKQPHGVVFVEPRDFSQPTPYELRHMHPFRYKVVARLVDYANPAPEDAPVPRGGYPDFCTFVSAPEGNVAVIDAAPTTGIDITLYDNGGADDPCGKGGDVCPKTGAGTLEVQIALDRAREAITAPDQLVFAVLTGPTQAIPTRFRILPASELAAKGFPHTVVINDVPPGAYIVYACYDVGGNGLMGCGPEDFTAAFTDDNKLAVPDAKITSVRLDLNASMATLLAVDDPPDRGCP
jgi:hypothetical protein